MGLLNFFSKQQGAPLRLPAGSFTIDANGQVISSTLPQSFPEKITRSISEAVLASFRLARENDSPLSELQVHYPALKLTAREMRGGAMIFLSPRSGVGR